MKHSAVAGYGRCVGAGLRMKKSAAFTPHLTLIANGHDDDGLLDEQDDRELLSHTYGDPV